jgi:hypothetical protein
MASEKHLPIKIFQKRISDERKTEGGGSKSIPKWLLNDEDLQTRSQEFTSVISET